MKGSGLLIASTGLLSIFLCFVYLFLMLALFLLVLLYLKSILYILFDTPCIFNSFPPCFWLDLLVALEIFEDGQKIALEYISETIFFLDGEEGKDVVNGRKGMLVVIVADDHLRDHVFLFWLRKRCFRLLVLHKCRFYLWLYFYYILFGLYLFLYLFYNFPLSLHFNRHILFFLSKFPVHILLLLPLRLNVGLLSERLSLYEHGNITSPILLM